jgi:hypothetical protein
MGERPGWTAGADGMLLVCASQRQGVETQVVDGAENAAARIGDERQCVSGEQRGLEGLVSDSQPVLYVELSLFPREWV